MGGAERAREGCDELGVPIKRSGLQGLGHSLGVRESL